MANTNKLLANDIFSFIESKETKGQSCVHLQAIIWGILTSLVCLVAWFTLVVVWHQPAEYMAVVVGLLNGVVLMLLAKRLRKAFGATASILTLIASLVGIVATSLLLLPQKLNMSFVELTSQIDIVEVAGISLEYVKLMELVHLGVGLIIAFQIANSASILRKQRGEKLLKDHPKRNPGLGNIFTQSKLSRYAGQTKISDFSMKNR